MSKMKCHCGYIIVDQTDDLPCKGYVLPDQNEDDVLDTLAANLSDFIQAIPEGRRAQ